MTTPHTCSDALDCVCLEQCVECVLVRKIALKYSLRFNIYLMLVRVNYVKCFKKHRMHNHDIILTSTIFQPRRHSDAARENKIINYKGTNLSNETITSTANFLPSPETIEPYLIKTECFCFTEQTLKPGESQIFTMVFYVDPSIDSDWYFDNLKVLVFTYEFSEYKS